MMDVNFHRDSREEFEVKARLFREKKGGHDSFLTFRIEDLIESVTFFFKDMEEFERFRAKVANVTMGEY